jgi:hypothetical protein
MLYRLENTLSNNGSSLNTGFLGPDGGASQPRARAKITARLDRVAILAMSRLSGKVSAGFEFISAPVIGSI